MSESRATSVFISYSHDSDEHMDRVLGLSDKLRADGIDCLIDQYETTPRGGWARWTRDKITEADYVLVVCTEAYKRRYEATEKKGIGAGAKWEGGIITQHLYGEEGAAHKFIPVIFSADDERHIPIELQGRTYYVLDSERGYELLYRHLTNQPEVVKQQLGELRSLPPRQRKQSSSKGRSEVQADPPQKTVMSDDGNERASGGGDKSFDLNPMGLLREAIRAVPAVKYALGIAGIVSVIAIVAAFRMDLRVALFGAIIMIILMTVLVIFANLTTVTPRSFLAPIMFLMWSSLVLTVVSAALLCSSVFFRWPVDLQYLIHPAPVSGTGNEEPKKGAANTSAPSPSPAGERAQRPESTPRPHHTPVPPGEQENDSLNLLNRREEAENAANKPNTPRKH